MRAGNIACPLEFAVMFMKKNFLLIGLTIVCMLGKTCYAEDAYSKVYTDEQWIELKKNVTKKTVFCENKNDICYVKISEFGKETYDEFVNILKEEKKEKLIVDLRNNRGGYIEAAAKISALFITDKKEVLSISYSDGSQKKFCGTGEYSNKSVVVLVNPVTASAAEAMALSLEESGFLCVGENTYGKSTVQRYTESGDKKQKNTVGVFKANDVDVQNVGITPNYVVHNDFDFRFDVKENKYIINEIDNQLHFAIVLLREGKK